VVNKRKSQKEYLSEPVYRQAGRISGFRDQDCGDTVFKWCVLWERPAGEEQCRRKKRSALTR